MPLLILLVLVLALPFLAMVLMPLGLIQRYRAGAARRVARPWVAALNVAALWLSVVMFLSGAALTNLWVPRAFSYSLAGLAGGCLLGLLGLTLTRWDPTPARLHFTPNRFLVLAITLLVAARLAYGIWRLWQSWHLGGGQGAWLIHSGVPGSLAAGAIVLGYSLAFWMGVRRQSRRFQGGSMRPESSH